MKTLGVGILGFGFMGKTHTYAHRTIPLYYDPVPVKCRMVSVCEVTDKLAQAARETGEFERCTTDPLALINAPDIDIVHVCTPNQEHFSALAAAIKAGKHIYVDKPATANLTEAEQLTALLAGYRGVAQVALQIRSFPAVLHAKQLVDEGFLGPITHFRAAYLHSGSVDPAKGVNWKSTAAAGGGVIRDLGSHVIDLLWWLIQPMDSVNCISRIWSRQRPNLDKPGTTMTIDVEDAAVMMFKRADGVMGVVEASKVATGAEDELRFEIHGRHGAIRFNGMQPNYLEIYDGKGGEGVYGAGRGWQQVACVGKYPPPGGKFPNPKFAIGWLRSHVHCLYSFLDAIAHGRPGSPSLQEAIAVQRVLESVRASAQTEQWVDLS